MAGKGPAGGFGPAKKQQGFGPARTGWEKKPSASSSMPTFTTGGRIPVWDHFAFADVFADSVLDAANRREEISAPPFVRLAGSLHLLQTSLSRLLKEGAIHKGETAVTDHEVML